MYVIEPRPIRLKQIFDTAFPIINIKKKYTYKRVTLKYFRKIKLSTIQEISLYIFNIKNPILIVWSIQSYTTQRILRSSANEVCGWRCHWNGGLSSSPRQWQRTPPPGGPPRGHLRSFWTPLGGYEPPGGTRRPDSPPRGDPCTNAHRRIRNPTRFRSPFGCFSYENVMRLVLLMF